MSSQLAPEVRYLPAFVPDAAALFDTARRELGWTQRIAARQTASCGLAYDYSGLTYPDTPMPAFVRALADRISRLVEHPITNCLGNLYETGDSRMGFHSDSSEGIVLGTTTSILSLGFDRELTFRSKDAERRTTAFPLEAGSLLVMAASVQDLWMHAVLPVAASGSRISLTFRHIAER